MEINLADILGWEEGAVYKYKNKFFKIKQGLLVSSLTGKQNSWCVDWSVEVNSIFYLKEATKVEPKKYYLRHKYLDIEQFSYLNYKVITKDFELNSKCCDGNFQTQFTEEEIKEIEKTGFDLTNFESIEKEGD